MATQNMSERRSGSILHRVRWDVISGGVAFAAMNRADDHGPLGIVEKGAPGPSLRTDTRKVIKFGPFWGAPMKDGDLPDIGQVTTEVVDGLRIRIARGGRPNGSAILFTSP